MIRRRSCRRSGLAAVVALCALGLGALPSRIAAQSKPGGDTTVVDEGVTAFGRALGNLDPLRWNDLRAGKARFVREWPQRGPWADAASCADCHFHDGRGPRPDRTSGGLSHLARLGATPAESDPIYGIQLRRSGYGVAPPGRFDIEWQEVTGRYPSGEAYVLRRPVVRVRDLAYGALHPATRLSLRVPPAVFGLGLLEAIAEPDILAFADPDDRNGDGVSGRPQRVRDPATGHDAIGRFGWKAAQASIAAQSAAALVEDLGVTSPLATAIRGAHVADNRGEPEIGGHEVTSIVRYLRALAVPAQREPADPVVRDGQALFTAVGCADCHRRSFTTGTLPGWPELSGQRIEPYTDLLLHDMGPRLADEVSEGAASGGEWRTPPLWGLGLVSTVSGGAGLLHDGRARSAEDAILWHGGEADRSRERFEALPPTGRRALLRFLDSL